MGRELESRREEIIDAAATELIGASDSRVNDFIRSYCRTNSIPATALDIADMGNEAIRRQLVSSTSSSSHTHTASEVTDFDTEVANNSAVTANTVKVTNATHTGDVTGDTGLTIAADAVTYAKLQNVVADNVILGNNAGAGGIVDELTATEVRTLLNVEDGSTADQTSIVGITGTMAEFDTAVTDGDIQYVGDAPTAHTIVSHSDTTATGAELTALINNSTADNKHWHSKLVASDGSPDPALSVDADGSVEIIQANANVPGLLISNSVSWPSVMELNSTGASASARLQVLRFADVVGDSSIAHFNNDYITAGLQNELRIGVNNSGDFKILTGVTGATESLVIDGGTSAATFSGTLTVQGAFTSPGIDDNATSNAITIEADNDVSFAGKIGIGKSPAFILDVVGSVQFSSTIFGGDIKLGNGTPANPTHRFSSDSNTGMYRVTTDTLGFSTAGLNALTLDSSQNATFAADGYFAGNVGIGTTSPDAPLEVSSTVPVLLHLHEEDSGVGEILFTNSTDTDGWYTGITGTEKFGISRNIDMDAGAEFIIQQDGNVGIGTTSPVSLLSIKGTSSVDSFSGQVDIISSETSGAVDTGGTLMFSGHSGTEGRGFTYIRGMKENSTSGEYGSYLSFGVRTNGTASVDERMRITSAGNVGIGTTSPATKLDVAGAVTTSGILSVDDTTDSTSTTTGSIHTDGGLGVAKDIIAGANIDVTGDYKANGVALAQSFAVSKSADETINSDAVLSDDADLTIAVEANTNYRVELNLSADSSITPDFQYQITVPTGAALTGIAMNVAGTSGASAAGVRLLPSTPIMVSGTATSISLNASATGILRVGGTAGNVVVQWAQNTSHASDTTLLEGSHMILTKLP